MEVVENAPLASLTSLGVGGSARYLVRVQNEKELIEAVRFSQEQTSNTPIILGAGSNVLFSDANIHRVVIQLRADYISIKAVTPETMHLKVGAGTDWDKLVAYTCERDLSGLENLSGIPGTVGAAPVQNINAYGISVAEAITTVRTYDPVIGVFKDMSVDECRFGYRDSIFKKDEGKHLIITEVVFCLNKNTANSIAYKSASQSIEKIILERAEQPSPLTIRRAVLEARSNIGMLAGQYRSAGSFFKNTIVPKEKFTQIKKVIEEKFSSHSSQFSPWCWEQINGSIKISTAFLLECSKYNKTTYGQRRINGVGISPKHSLSIVTEVGASARGVQNFCQLVQRDVQDIFSIDLEPEVVFIGE